MSSKASDPRQNTRRRRSRSPSQLLKSSTKSIRGLLKGKKSSAKKRKTPEATAAAAPAPATNTSADVISFWQKETQQDTDDISVYNVELDSVAPTVSTRTKESPPAKKDVASTDDSTAEKTTSTRRASRGSPLDIVLLIMDGETRRFELIQLSFDAEIHTASDIVKQIAVNATESCLREQNYKAVCFVDGTLMKDDCTLKTYEDHLKSDRGIVLAVPEGMTAEDCVRLSHPILHDESVIKMLKGVGINIILEPAPEVETPVDNAKDATEDEDKKEEDMEDSKEMKKEEENDEMNDKKMIEEMLETIPPPVTKEEMPEPMVKKLPPPNHQSDIGSVLLTFVVLWLLIPNSISVHWRITSPLSPGVKLPAGQWRSKCGIFSFLPEDFTGCNHSILEMSGDGALTLSKTEGGVSSVVWKMEGKCSDDDDCVAFIDDNGQITIGGSVGEVTEGQDSDVSLSPWPFTVEPPKPKQKRRGWK